MLFIPLAKADATQRLVSGFLDETPDRAREVMDYETAKAAFQDWSAEMEKASGGKSLGNIRGQHSNIAAGKLVELTFDDLTKTIGVVAKIVDDNEWQKVEEGVYTGFSPGGRYAKRWQDGEYKRYTPLVRELSIVDIPCKPESTFTMVKADGSEEEREFVLDQAYEPGNEATLGRAEELAKAAGKPGKGKDFVVKARAELIAENADGALAKMADAEADDAEQPEADPAPADPVAALEAAMNKAASVLAPADAEASPFADLAKLAAALALLQADGLAKSLWSTEWLSRLLREFADLQGSITWDEKMSNAGSGDVDLTIPTMAANIVVKIGELLVEMARDGVADLITNIERCGIEVTVAEGDGMELAVQVIDLVKADTDLMEKAGARNSKADTAMIQTIHDHACKLGAGCGDEVSKDAVSALTLDRDRLAKAVESATPQIEELTQAVADGQGELAKAQARIAELEALPEPAKGVVRAVSKEEDGGALAKADDEEELTGSLLERAERRRFHS